MRAGLVFAAAVTTTLVCPQPSSGQAVSLPARFDWTARGIMTPARDQGDFGTCWTFASVGLLEALIKWETGVEVDLSEQYLVSNIDGIGPLLAMEFMKTRGVVLERDLPYRGDTSSVNTSRPGEYFLADYGVKNVHGLSLGDRVTAIKQLIHEHGPLATTMNLFEDFKHHKSGVYVYDGHSPEQTGGHIILITGWEDDPTILGGGYWIVKNSAGTRWGEEGFGKVAYGQAGVDDYYVIHGVLKRPAGVR